MTMNKTKIDKVRIAKVVSAHPFSKLKIPLQEFGTVEYLSKVDRWTVHIAPTAKLHVVRRSGKKAFFIRHELSIEARNLIKAHNESPHGLNLSRVPRSQRKPASSTPLFTQNNQLEI